MREKLLIICKSQLGTLTDVYKWCTYLRDTHDITILCFDIGNPKLKIPGIKVKYVDYSGLYLFRGIRFLIHSLWNILCFKGKIMVVYFEHCPILKSFFPFRRILLDIRTQSVSPYPEKRHKENNAIMAACRKFDLVSVISEGVQDNLRLTHQKVKILPLGADCISDTPKDYTAFHLLYVGTLYNRDIHKTIQGLALFRKKHPDAEITYDIVGDGYHNEIEQLRTLTMELGMDDCVTLHGRISNTRLKPYFDKSCIGVSFVPITPYYDHQPPTKTYEYGLSGLYTIATDTFCNRALINKQNGTLINDTPEHFADGLEHFSSIRHLLDETTIRNSFKKHAWENIIKYNLYPILNLL